MKYSIRFFLGRPDKDKKSKEVKLIYFYITWGSNRLRKSTGLKCRQCDWNETNYRVSNKQEYANQVNSNLTDLEYKVEKYFQGATDIPTESQVLEVVTGQGKEVQDKSFRTLFDRFIKETENGTRKSKQGKQIKALTIRAYYHTWNLLEAFSEAKKVKLEWKNINFSFYQKFTDYLFDDLGYYDNACGSIVKELRAFLNWCVEESHITRKLHDKNWIIWKEEIDMVVLYPDELNLLFNIDPPTDRLKRTKDLFLAGCMTCLRVTNLLGLGPENIVGNRLKLIAVKADKVIYIDIPPMLMSIFNKYESLLPKVSQQKFNEALKDLGKWLAGYIAENKLDCKPGFIGNDWSKPMLRTRYKRGVPIMEKVELTEMISSHTMRRTGITNLLMMGLSETEVKSISGHALDSDDFPKYVKFAEQFISKKSNEAWGKIAKM